MDADAALDLAEQYLCPHRVATLRGLGVPLVIGRREGYRIWGLDGHELIDVHLNGGVYNLGHRHPVLVEALREALDSLDIGNHHFPSAVRAQLAARLVGLTPGGRYAVLASGGGEAMEVALKSARRATGRRRIISVEGAYHGHTGLALAAGDERAAAAFLSDDPAFTHVPYDDLGALEAALADGDAAAVVLETVPATLGFPSASPGYLAGVRGLCDRFGALYVADEVQTGLGRTGRMWAVERDGVVPDALVTGKGLSGGLYPMAAAVLGERAGAWLRDDGWAHISTFGGAELGCPVSLAVLDLTTAPATVERVAALTALFTTGLADLQVRHPSWLLEVRQTGLVIGLRFADPAGGMLMTKALYDRGVWAMFAGFDPSVLQVKPGLLLDDADAALVLAALDDAMSAAGSAAGAGEGAGR